MLFHNRLLEPEPLPDDAVRIPFHQLAEADYYQHEPGGTVSQIAEHGPNFRTIRRADGWLIPARVGDFVWDKTVIKVAPLRK